MAVGKVPSKGPSQRNVRTQTPPSQQREQLDRLKNKVSKIIEVKPTTPTFQKQAPSSSKKLAAAAQGKIQAAMPTFQKNPPSADKRTRKDTVLAFQRIVKSSRS